MEKPSGGAGSAMTADIDSPAMNGSRTSLSWEKRPVSQMTIENIVNEIEDLAVMKGKTNHEIDSREIGELVLDKLGSIDRVAYIRFASVYRHFNDMDEFIREIQKLGWTGSSVQGEEQKNSP